MRNLRLRVLKLDGKSLFSRRRRVRQGGFVITLELMIIMSIMAVVFVFAIALFQQWWLDNLPNLFGRNVYVFDNDGVFIGKAIGFNEFEAPQILYRGGDPSDPNDNFLAALLGVRPERFTTNTFVYFANPDCAGDPYMLNPDDLDAPAVEMGSLPTDIALDFGNLDPPECVGNIPICISALSLTGSGVEVEQPMLSQISRGSDFYSLQGTAFAIGPGNGLYSTDGSGAPPANFTVGSRYVSEMYGAADADRCINFTISDLLAPVLRPATFVVDMDNVFAPNYWVPAVSVPSPPLVPGPGFVLWGGGR